MRWWDDARAVLAILAVVGAFSLQGFMIVNNANSPSVEVPSIPTWTAATVSAIVGFYFGAKGGGDGGNGNGNGKGKNEQQ